MSIRHLNLSKAPFIPCLTEVLLLVGSLFCMPRPHFQVGEVICAKEGDGSCDSMQNAHSFPASTDAFCFLDPSLMYSFGVPHLIFKKN